MVGQVYAGALRACRGLALRCAGEEREVFVSAASAAAGTVGAAVACSWLKWAECDWKMAAALGRKTEFRCRGA